MTDGSLQSSSPENALLYMEPLLTPDSAPAPNPVTLARSARANAVKSYGLNAPQAVETARDLAAAKLLRAVQEVVASAPPLTASQREAIISTLAPSALINK